MHKPDYIQENRQSADPIIREMFQELDIRIEELDNNKLFVEKMRLTDATIPILISIVIIINFIYTIL
ncbi:hypothetical protein [Peribacillus sp. TH14]|uniref:hypothetical protein n=1 Tax=Peribacillus sp. TH14 TaxID=2798481 RepID=UPI0019134DDD|nr:hypothetical protein [Peribacillus sp. TH14]MBK5501391.1 hypothetical protein [Peribacillus sp. TH14]